MHPPFPSRLFVLLCSGALLLLGNRGLASPVEPPGIEVVIDKKSVDQSLKEIPVPVSSRSLLFRIGNPPTSRNPNARRVRYRLEGVDQEWNEYQTSVIPNGIEMTISLRFLDASGNSAGTLYFQFSGKSPGWKETPEDSVFTRRREHVRVPDGAASVIVTISSAGPASAMGVLLIKDIEISRQPSDKPAPELLYRSLQSLPRGGANENATPPNWIRDGGHRSMARIVSLGDSTEWAFGIYDDDPLSHAEWHTIAPVPLAVIPGEDLRVDWEELFNIGDGNMFGVAYAVPQPGLYRFRVNELDFMGRPTPVETGVTLRVPLPFWKSPWFWFACLAVAGTLLLLGSRWLIRFRIRQHLARAHQEHLIVQERLRIARDLHDDLGARLTHISLVSSLAEKASASPGTTASFQQISEMTRELVSALYETVWSVNPENDNLETLVDFLTELTQNLCEPAAIRCRFRSGPIPNNRPVSSTIRHNITMVVKECVHNAVKHANATEINGNVEFQNGHLLITISDNGRGFIASEISAGHGLANMRERMTRIGGNLSMESSPEGTRVCLDVPIH